jgi:acetylornithine deacetylase/succinyl-diaminopimelate desuccinylase-like protein
MNDLVTDRDLDELLYHLDNLVRLDSSAGTGGQASVARYVAGVLAAEGLASEQVPGPDGALNLVARLSAHRPDQALIVAAPTDVAPADPADWTHPPFAATTADGQVRGRGVLEPKRALAMGLMLPIVAQRRRLRMKRDLVLVATADGEGDGTAGIRTIAAQRPDLLRGEACLAGPGGHDLHLGGRVIVPIRVASLGFALVRVRARTGDRDAIFTLADSLQRIESGRLEPRMCEAGIAFLSGINGALPRGRAFAMRGLRLGGLTATVLRALDDGELAAMASDMAHDTVAVTRFAAGDGRHHVPVVAEAVLSLRVLPGRPLEDALRQLARRLGDEVAMDVIASAPPVEAPPDHPFAAHLAGVVRAARPDALPVHYAAFAGPEPATMAELGIPTFGYAPIGLPAGFDYRGRVRGIDESAPLAGIREGFAALARAALDWCAPTDDRA